MKLQISEIFYSLQGEGARAGSANIFIRTQGCKAANACYAMGIKCDTEFESGKELNVEELLTICDEIAPSCKNIIWTGGEPAQQLTPEIVKAFKDAGYYQAIETSGLLPVCDGIDYIVVSPKVAEHVIKKNFPKGVQELRYVRHKGQSIPQPSVQADRYYISPHSDGWDINTENVAHCISLCLANPIWSLSVQQHKLWNVL